MLSLQKYLWDDCSETCLQRGEQNTTLQNNCVNPRAEKFAFKWVLANCYKRKDAGCKNDEGMSRSNTEWDQETLTCIPGGDKRPVCKEYTTSTQAIGREICIN